MIPIWLVVLALAGAAYPARADQSPEHHPGVGREALQAEVINYAERFLAVVGQAAYVFGKELPTPQARLVSARRKVFTLNAAVTIAAGPDPAAALLDMVVLASLSRMVWQDYWQPEVFGQPAAVMVSAFQEAEADIFSVAARFMTAGQLRELRDLIEAWHVSHPNQRAVDFIRFRDFGDLVGKPELKKIKEPGGLLAPVEKAVQAADEIRMTSERAMFLVSKMQLLVGVQTELIYKELVMQPEVTSLLNDVTGFRQQMGALPDQIARERHATLKEISQLAAKERTQILAAFDEREAKLRGILTDARTTMDRADVLLGGMRETMTSAERTMAQTQSTGEALKELVVTIDRLTARLESDRVRKEGKLFDIEDYIRALEQLNRTVRDATALVGAVDQTSVPLIKALTESLDRTAEKQVDHAFQRLLILVGCLGLIGIALLVVHHRLKRKG
jgi:hypothetical protein